MTEKTVAKFQVISFTFTITDESGQVQEQSPMPMDYIHGLPNSQMFPKVEAALEGKKVGDSVSVTLTPAEAFGEHDPQLVYRDKVDNVPMQYRYVGARPVFRNDRGEQMEFEVTAIEDGNIIIDGNHPYVGKTLTFEVTIDAIREASDAEVSAFIDQTPASNSLQ